MAIYPENVEIDEAKILKIASTYKSAYKQIVEEISTATNFGVANRKAILAQIQVILRELKVDVDQFLQEELPEFYVVGAEEAVKQLKNVGAKVGIAEGFNRVHNAAIAALVDDTSKAFGESLTGVGRSARVLLGKVIRETLTRQMAKGLIAGEALREVKKTIKTTLQEQGLDALVDKGGRSWTLDRYSEMLFRTKAVEARNRGLINRMVENGYDLVQVSSHPTSCPICAPWQGKILSSTGADSDYPSLTEAESQGLFHPNAVLSGTTFVPYGKLDEMIAADYEGPAIVIHTAEGYELTIGPNHPVFTQRGLIKSSLLTENDYLVYDSRVIPSQISGNSNFEQVPMVEDAFKTLLLSDRGISIVPTPSHDFHGDIIFCKGEVKVIKPTASLLPVFNSGGIEKFRNGGFVITDMQTVILSGNCPKSFGFDSIDLTASGFVSSTLSSYKFVHITSIHNIRFNGKAFDAQTESSLYNSNGFVVSNCRHAINTLTPSLAKQTKAYDAASKSYR